MYLKIECERDCDLRTFTFYIGMDKGYYTLENDKPIAQIVVPDKKLDNAQERIVAFMKELWGDKLP